MGVKLGLLNILTSATLSATVGTPELGIDYLLSDFWEAGSSASLTADMGSVADADYIAIAGHNLSSGSYTLSGSNNDVDYTPITTASPSDDGVIWDEFTSQSWKYYKLFVTGTEVQIAHISIGKLTELPGQIAIPFTPIEYDESITQKAAQGRHNLFMRKEISSYNNLFNMSVRNITQSWTDANWPVVKMEIVKHPFFILWKDGEGPAFGSIKTASIRYQNTLHNSIDLKGVCVV